MTSQPQTLRDHGARQCGGGRARAVGKNPKKPVRRWLCDTADGEWQMTNPNGKLQCQVRSTEYDHARCWFVDGCLLENWRREAGLNPERMGLGLRRQAALRNALMWVTWTKLGQAGSRRHPPPGCGCCRCWAVPRSHLTSSDPHRPSNNSNPNHRAPDQRDQNILPLASTPHRSDFQLETQNNTSLSDHPPVSRHRAYRLPQAAPAVGAHRNPAISGKLPASACSLAVAPRH